MTHNVLIPGATEEDLQRVHLATLKKPEDAQPGEVRILQARSTVLRPLVHQGWSVTDQRALKGPHGVQDRYFGYGLVIVFLTNNQTITEITKKSGFFGYSFG
jgi:hypothetical protein